MDPMSLTSDLDSQFFPALENMATRLGGHAYDFAAVMYSESQLLATAHNDNPKHLAPELRYNASGINQMMPKTLQGLGYTRGHAAYRTIGATAQLTYVEAYFRPYKGYLDTIEGIYLANFLPALIRHAKDPMFVLTAKGGPLGWAYAANASLDVNGDAAITVFELGLAVVRNCKGARWEEIVRRMKHGDAAVAPDFDLGTVLGLQQALHFLEFYTGNLDGIRGPLTSSAILRFQQFNNVKPEDGIFGPITRAALQKALEAERVKLSV